MIKKKRERQRKKRKRKDIERRGLMLKVRSKKFCGSRYSQLSYCREGANEEALG